MAKTEVEEAAAVKVATKVELGIALRMDPHGPDSQRGRERVCSLLGAGGMHFEVQERPSRTARWWLGMRTLAQQKECLWSPHLLCSRWLHIK